MSHTRTDLKCQVCGEELPKYGLDRFSDDLCGPYCDGLLSGQKRAAAAIVTWLTAKMVLHEEHGEQANLSDLIDAIQRSEWAPDSPSNSDEK